jgi:Na+-driven multidrug efflux pump
VGDLLYIVIVVIFFALMFGLLVLCGRTLGAGERDASLAAEQAPAGEQNERS